MLYFCKGECLNVILMILKIFGGVIVVKMSFNVFGGGASVQGCVLEIS